MRYFKGKNDSSTNFIGTVFNFRSTCLQKKKQQLYYWQNNLQVLIFKYLPLELQKNPVEGFSAGLVDESNVFDWELLIYGPPDTLYEGGMFKAILKFPKDYPGKENFIFNFLDNPPVMKFATPIWVRFNFLISSIQTCIKVNFYFLVFRWKSLHKVNNL